MTARFYLFFCLVVSFYSTMVQWYATFSWHHWKRIGQKNFSSLPQTLYEILVKSLSLAVSSQCPLCTRFLAEVLDLHLPSLAFKQSGEKKNSLAQSWKYCIENLWLEHFQFSSGILKFAKKTRGCIQNLKKKIYPIICNSQAWWTYFWDVGLLNSEADRVQVKIGLPYFSECPAPSGIGC